jgi:hypothetical protein
MSRLANILAAALLALAVAVSALWVRSYFVQDRLLLSLGTRCVGLHSLAARVGKLIHMRRSVRWLANKP